MELKSLYLGIKDFIVVDINKMIAVAQNKKFPDLYNCSIAILGIGYVGLPLAIHFTKVKSCISTKKKFKRHIIGFDINKKRIEELKNGNDRTNEITNALCSSRLAEQLLGFKSKKL